MQQMNRDVFLFSSIPMMQTRNHTKEVHAFAKMSGRPGRRLGTTGSKAARDLEGNERTVRQI
eukprot:scaffold3732_cov147-Amphora_coffeaeformis.AAC.5